MPQRPPSLAGRVVVVAAPAVRWAMDLASDAVGAGATVVLATADAEAAGELAASLRSGPGRVAVFALADDDPDGSGAALVEFVREQFVDVGPR